MRDAVALSAQVPPEAPVPSATPPAKSGHCPPSTEERIRPPTIIKEGNRGVLVRLASQTQGRRSGQFADPFETRTTHGQDTKHRIRSWPCPPAQPGGCRHG